MLDDWDALVLVDDPCEAHSVILYGLFVYTPYFACFLAPLWQKKPINFNDFSFITLSLN